MKFSFRKPLRQLNLSLKQQTLILQKQVDFTQNDLIGTRWTKFEKLALLSYSDQGNYSTMGAIKDLTGVVKFMQDNGRVSVIIRCLFIF
jgi:hypothetical protein